MGSIAVTSVAFGCIFGGAVSGMMLRAVIPPFHLVNDSKDAVRVAMGLVATMTAIVLGMLISSAKSYYDTQSTEVTQMAAKIVVLDRALAHYGPEGDDARGVLRSVFSRLIDQMWSKDLAGLSQVSQSTEANALFDKIQTLSPKDEKQRALQNGALNLSMTVTEMRWLMYNQRLNSVSMPLLIVLVFWLSLIFVGFGLFAPPNATVITTLFVSSLSVSGAVFLILNMYSPYEGLIRVSKAPMRAALANLGQ
jgi:Protein of unknown function (DUF4239)